MKKIALVLAASALTATTAFAEGEAPVVADADGNTTFSLAEVQVAYPNVTEEAFKAADADASGELSAEELAAAVEAGAFAVSSHAQRYRCDGGNIGSRACRIAGRGDEYGGGTGSRCWQTIDRRQSPRRTSLLRMDLQRW